MFEVFTGWKVAVEVDDACGPYIVIPEQQLAELCGRLSEHLIPHALDGAVPITLTRRSPSWSSWDSGSTYLTYKPFWTWHHRGTCPVIPIQRYARAVPSATGCDCVRQRNGQGRTRSQ